MRIVILSDKNMNISGSPLSAAIISKIFKVSPVEEALLKLRNIYARAIFTAASSAMVCYSGR